MIGLLIKLFPALAFDHIRNQPQLYISLQSREKRETYVVHCPFIAETEDLTITEKCHEKETTNTRNKYKP